ncbi:MAG TPA: LysR family transcriptional regulator [Casimicrobiaceae bacterium]|nr:LysR family transcriptional regulator [Casimicrobiaceae bacterium]
MPLLRNAALLRDFLAVTRTGSLSAAALELDVSQPALTKSIRRLERHYGIALFERRARGMALTPFGETLLGHAKLIDAQCRFADAEMQAFAEGKGGRIRVGAGLFWGATLLPIAIAALQQRMPGLKVDLEVGVNTVIHPRLFSGDLDVVVCALPEGEPWPSGIEVHPVFDLDMRVIAGEAHPLLKRRKVEAVDLAPYPWALYQHDREIMQKLIASLRGHGGTPPKILVESTSVVAVMELLRAGPYLSCIADAFLRVRRQSGIRVVPYRHDIWSCPSGALYHASLARFAPMQALLGAIDDVSRQVELERRFHHSG